MDRSLRNLRKQRMFSSGSYLEGLMAELDRAAICQRIGLARDEAGLTQPELGEALEPKMHWRTVQTWESVKEPRVPWGRLDEIARVTGRTKEWLLHGEDFPPPNEVVVRLDRIEQVLEELVARLERDAEAVAP